MTLDNVGNVSSFGPRWAWVLTLILALATLTILSCNGDSPTSGDGSDGGSIANDWFPVADGTGIADLCVVSEYNVFAVTQKGMAYHYDGHSWEWAGVGTGYSDSRIIKGPNGEVLTFRSDYLVWLLKGRAWHDLDYPWGRDNLDRPVGGFFETDGTLWLVGRDGWLSRFDGTGWQIVVERPDPQWLTDMAQASTGAIFAVGDDGWIVQLVENAWVQVPSGTSAHLLAVKPDSSGHLLAIGESGTAVRFDANSYQLLSTGTNENLIDLWIDANDVAYITSDQGTVFRCVGTNWDVFHEAEIAGPVRISGTRTGSMYLSSCDQTLINRQNGNEWERLLWMPPRDIHGLWGSSAFNMIAVGDSVILHCDGYNWREDEFGREYALKSVWGASDGAVYAVGDECMLRYNGSTWSEVVGDHNYFYREVHGVSDTDIFAVGEAGVIQHFDGSSWSTQSSGTTSDLNCVWAHSPERVFAVGDGGTIILLDSTGWRSMTSQTGNDLLSVWSNPNHYVYASARGGTIYYNHSYRSRWSNLSPPNIDDIEDLWGDGIWHMVGVGEFGRVLTFDRSVTPDKWSQEFGATRFRLRAIWGFSRYDMFAAGDHGTITRFAPPTRLRFSSWLLSSGSGSGASREKLAAVMSHIDPQPRSNERQRK